MRVYCNWNDHYILINTFADQDFVLNNNVLKIPNSQFSQACATLMAIDDNLPEDTESFTIALEEDNIPVNFNVNIAMITILDNDRKFVNL